MSRKYEGITEEELRDLYLVQLKTEAEIGEMFGVGQVLVGRLRKRYGIPTLGKGGRVGASLPPTLTDYQEQVLIGSLLGDGCIHKTNSDSAYFSEGHSLKQKDYCLWKAEVFKPYTVRIDNIQKRTGDKTFYGVSFDTHTCPQLKPYRNLFYPEGKKVFPKDLPDRMTSLVLAVWYMDDGHVSARGEPRITYGLCKEGLERALTALRRLGLQPKTYPDSRYEHLVMIGFPKQTMKFKELVEPHMHSSMLYKMPFESEGAETHRHARELTPEKAKELYEGGLSVADIAEIYQVGTSTVNRRLGDLVTKRKTRKTHEYTLESGSAKLQSLMKRIEVEGSSGWESMLEEDKKGLVGGIVGVLRRCPFPYTPVPSPEGIQKALDDVKNAQMELRDGVVSPIRTVGISLCNAFFPNRYRAVSRGVKSAYEAWYTDKDLRRAVEFQLGVGDPVVPHRVLRAVTMKCRTPSIFRPTVAKWVYGTYCPVGGVVWDPCSGFGGRLLGAVSAGVRYIGTDVDEETIAGNLRLAEAIGAGGMVQLHLCPAEKFVPPEPLDLVFTSPPYFNRELYSQGGNQSWKLGAFEDWVSGFLAPVIQTASDNLKPNGYLVLNVADIRYKGEIVPLEAKVKEVAIGYGNEFVERLELPLPKLNRANPHEAILVFRRGANGNRKRD